LLSTQQPRRTFSFLPVKNAITCNNDSSDVQPRLRDPKRAQISL